MRESGATQGPCQERREATGAEVSHGVCREEVSWIKS